MTERFTQKSSDISERGPIKISWLPLLDPKTPEGLIFGGFEPEIEGNRVKVTVPEDVSPYLLRSAPFTLRGMLSLRVDEIVFLRESGQIMIDYHSNAKSYFFV